MFYTEDTRLSASYTLEDLTKTSQVLALPNLPLLTEKWILDNLVFLADRLEELGSVVGPFVIISGYRTGELQQKLAESGEPTGSGSTKSFHEVGRAVDLYPTTMGIAEFFGKLLANENLRLQFAEISIKPSQNALHLAINVPGDVRAPKISGLNSQNVYQRLSAEEIQKYVEKYTPNSLEVAESVYEGSESGSNLKLYLALGAGAALLTALLV